MLPLFCNCLLAGISLLIKPPVKISLKDNAGSSAASLRDSAGVRVTLMSHSARLRVFIYQLRAPALRGRGSPQGWVMCLPFQRAGSCSGSKRQAGNLEKNLKLCILGLCILGSLWALEGNRFLLLPGGPCSLLAPGHAPATRLPKTPRARKTPSLGMLCLKLNKSQVFCLKKCAARSPRMLCKCFSLHL